MTPIQDLLHRIQWDAEFGKGRFVIGYLDRVVHRIVKVPFRRVRLARGNHFSFEIVDGEQEPRMIPFHRVRAVWRDGALIWQRPTG